MNFVKFYDLICLIVDTCVRVSRTTLYDSTIHFLVPVYVSQRPNRYEVPDLILL